MTRKRENVIVEVRDNIIRRTVQALARKGTSEDLGRVLDVLSLKGSARRVGTD
jgi:hypothetical protein